jgi:tRNA U34 5-methylaminomethyl-2-thiouridine-forming methyltransferase MnmC
MTWPACAADRGAADRRGGGGGSGQEPLRPRRTRDGSFSLWSPAVGEGFHSADGALAEARRIFVDAAELYRWRPGRTVTVVEVAVGTGTNTACLLEALDRRHLTLRWWGLEQDRRPLALARIAADFRRQWPAAVLAQMERLCDGDGLLWGDARRMLPDLLTRAGGRCDLVLLDAFSPRRCPELWTLEFLRGLARLLTPTGRLLTYSSAAAVRRALLEAGLQLAAIRSLPGSDAWSAGTVAAPSALRSSAILRPLTAMEWEHLRSRAGEPYRDPSGAAAAAAILQARAIAQQGSAAEPATAWRRRWRLPRRSSPGAGPPPWGR